MKRREFLSALAAPAILSARASSQPPNIVIALCDDLGYGDLACFGSKRIKTPNLDRFAGEGLRFTDCYASAPVCSPSRGGMLTGLSPNRLGIYDWIPGGSPMHLRREEVTFARLLKQAGYATCHSGKWHLNGKFNSPEQPQPGDHGFDHWFSTQNNAAPSHEDPNNFVRNGRPAGPLKGFSSTLIVEEALAWLRNLDAGRPFCLYLCFHAPHEPIATAEEFVGMYRDADKKGQAEYFGNVTQMDHEFGRLMRFLDQRGKRGDTCVLFTSDNGPETLNRYPGAWRSHGSPGLLRGMKLSLYEGGYRIPGMLRWPGRAKPGTVSREPVSNVDVLPTLCEMAGVKPPAGRALDGASILPVLEGRPVARGVPLHWHYVNAMDAPRASLRDGDWKVLGIPTRTAGAAPGSGFKPAEMPFIREQKLESFELYNLRTDPGEQNNLAAAEPRRTKDLAAKLAALDSEINKSCPEWS